MNSTGNDIVSLNAVDISRTLQPRFYSKILCATEISHHHQAGLTQIPFERYVWLLWSIKESAYKYLQRHNPNLLFSPTKFFVTRLEIPSENPLRLMEGVGFEECPVYKSIVTFGPESLYSRSLINQEFIFSVVNQTNDFENIHWGIKSIDNADPDHQSTEVRSFLMDKLDELLPYDDLSISKNTYGCPILLNGTNQINISVSLAHHGCWVAYSLQPQETLATISF